MTRANHTCAVLQALSISSSDPIAAELLRTALRDKSVAPVKNFTITPDVVKKSSWMSSEFQGTEVPFQQDELRGGDGVHYMGGEEDAGSLIYSIGMETAQSISLDESGISAELSGARRSSVEQSMGEDDSLDMEM